PHSSTLYRRWRKRRRLHRGHSLGFPTGPTAARSATGNLTRAGTAVPRRLRSPPASPPAPSRLKLTPHVFEERSCLISLGRSDVDVDDTQIVEAVIVGRDGEVETAPGIREQFNAIAPARLQSLDGEPADAIGEEGLRCSVRLVQGDHAPTDQRQRCRAGGAASGDGAHRADKGVRPDLERISTAIGRPHPSHALADVISGGLVDYVILD